MKYRIRSFQYLAGILFLGLIVIRMPALTSALALNLAHCDLLHWLPLLTYGEGKDLLERSIELGACAGSKWFEHGHGHRARELLAQMESRSWYERSRRWRAFETGRQLEIQGDIEAATMAYQESADQIELRVLSFFAMYRLMQQASDPIMAEEYLHHLTTLKPATQVHWAESDQYKLLGFDFDEWSIAWNGNHIPITLYWQLSESTDEPRQWRIDDWQYIQVQDRLYQIGEVSNLLPNGGFEQDLSTIAALPIGYRNIRDYRLRETFQIADYLHQYHGLIGDYRADYFSQVATMTSPPGQTNGFSAPRVPVEENGLYLLSGWMRTTGESEGYLAGVWEKDGIEFQYWKIADWSSPSSWQQYAEVMKPPSKTNRLRFIALQRGAGMVLFDDIFLCRFYPPNFEDIGN